MSFVYVAGPLSEFDSQSSEVALANRYEVPIVINTFYSLRPDLRTRFARIRKDFHSSFNPREYNSLDEYILRSGTPQGDDYRTMLKEHFEELLEHYRTFSEKVILVPGRYDLSVEEILSFNETFSLNLSEELLEEEQYRFQFCDLRTLTIGSDDIELLGIGGREHVQEAVPEIIQNVRYKILQETNQHEARKLLEEGADYFISGTGIPSTFDRELNQGETFELFHQMVPDCKLIIDPCVAPSSPEEIVTRISDTPLVHGKLEDFVKMVYLIRDHPDEHTSYDFTVDLFHREHRKFSFGWRDQSWVPIQASEDQEVENRQDSKQAVSTDSESDRQEGEKATSNQEETEVIVRNDAETAQTETSGPSVVIHNHYPKRWGFGAAVLFLILLLGAGGVFWGTNSDWKLETAWNAVQHTVSSSRTALRTTTRERVSERTGQKENSTGTRENESGTNSDEEAKPKPDGDAVQFSSPRFEQAVREEIGKTSEDLYKSNLGALRTLELDGYSIRSIKDVKHFSGLRELSLRGNEITDLSPLRHLKHLRILDVSRNNIQSLKAVKQLKELRTLKAPGNEITRIPEVEERPEVKMLDLRLNKLKHVKGIKTWEALRRLYLDSNNIHSIRSLSSLQELKELSLASNRIQDASSIGQLQNLRRLNLRDNEISGVESLQSLNNLLFLELANNQISSFPIRDQLPRLKTLVLTGNPVSHPSEVR